MLVARIIADHRPETFVRMAWMLRRKHPDVHYVFIGDGPLRGALTKEASELGLLDRMHFVGVREDVQMLLPSLALLIMPSHSEGMPLALMEANAAGVPAVATSVGGIPEIIARTITGLVLAPNDLTKLSAAVGELLDDPDRRNAMGDASRARAELWSVEAAFREMASYLGQVVENLDSRRTYVPRAPNALVQDERP